MLECQEMTRYEIYISGHDIGMYISGHDIGMYFRGHDIGMYISGHDISRLHINDINIINMQ